DVARLLDRGVTYQEIAKTHSASSATISRVNRCLSYGAGGYRLALDRIKDGD
ncbi:MAG: YerC/YecD family TrpR-related protein, partial [Clostridia bacterium]|nr:YerC/YecD family TrpR-related protein [Clostridia bacterium]